MTSKPPKLGKREIRAFQAQIWAFYAHSGRKLPWRNTKNPYKILVSEIMLQQTQVSRVLEKYPEFLKIFPDVDALAKAPLSLVLHTWQGMGYNRRAKYLHDTAQSIINEHGGHIPKTVSSLLKLPGIGNYTARAVVTFAYNKAEIFIETNIRRVYIHHFFGKKEDVTDKEILLLIQQTIDADNPREWYYALMDYGSFLPKAKHNNANLQSKHYTKQSTFKGSLRELRGVIIRTLDKSPSTLRSIKSDCGNDPRTQEAISRLLSEHLIQYEKRKYKLA